MDYFLCVLGMVCVIEAIPYIIFPHKMKEFALYMQTLPEKTLQLIGIIVAFTGIGILYLGRHLGGM
ncbi:MAG: DUF2065 domain-containing protein [Desulfomonilia bacterium]|nr:DUF2065 domain-containing protein [Desulfomonilia bacterium]